MAAWSSLLWHDTVDMLEYGTSFCHVPKSPLFIKCNASRHAVKELVSSTKLKNPGPVLPKDLFQVVPTEHVVAVTSDRGIHLSPSVELLRTVERQKKVKTGERNKGFKSSYKQQKKDATIIKSAVYTTKVPYSRLGW